MAWSKDIVYDPAVHESTQATAAAVGIVDASITAMNASVSTLLYNIGTAINQTGNKVSSTVEAASRAEREFQAAQEQNRRLEDARQRYQLPDNICSESSAGGSYQVAAASVGAKAKLRPGVTGKLSNASVAQAVNSPAPSQEVDAARSAKIHAHYCDADDYAAYGGAKACPSVSATMPGADKRVDSVLNGAGVDGKAPDLTFSQEQTDAALMYTQNSVRRSVGAQLGKGEADTVAGSQYVGLMTQLASNLSAAADPQEQRIADSIANPATKELIAEATASGSAATYFSQVASEEAKSTGMMSTREFEAFEVGRRYANTEYQADLQAMSGDNLLREQIRVTSMSNWLMLGIKRASARKYH
ncbi:conjugal transfer protein TraW [Pseudomonas asuensis]